MESRWFVWEGRVWRARGVRAAVGAGMGNEGMGRVRRESWMVGEGRRGNGRQSRGGAVFVGSVGYGDDIDHHRDDGY